MMKSLARLLMLGVAVSSLSLSVSIANAMSLKSATRVAIESNPNIGKAIANREATEFELKQALGLYLPRISLEASTGVERLNNPSRRTLGIQDNALFPSQISLKATYDIYDGGYRQSEANRQAARVDGASFRVLERSEYIALQIARVYFQAVLQQRVVDLSRENIAFHQTMLQNIDDAIKNGRLTEADRQQVQERLQAARAKMTQAVADMEAAKIEFYKYVGIPFSKPVMPSAIGRSLPRSLAQAIGTARLNNPQVKIADADLDAASALVEQAKSGLGPKLGLELSASEGYDVNGADGHTEDVAGKLVLKWDLYDDGIKNAQVQEQVRRESEAMMTLHSTHRDVEDAVRTSWSMMTRQRQLAAAYSGQVKASNDLVSSYKQQFSVGNRSLLDVLDAQNTRYNTQLLYQTAHFSARFGEYRLMAATGMLLKYLGLSAPKQADAYARKTLNSPSWKDTEPRKREPLNLSSPLDLTKFVN